MGLPYDPSCPSVGCSVGQSVCHKKGGKLHFHAPAPTGAPVSLPGPSQPLLSVKN